MKIINPKINQSLLRLKVQLSESFLAKQFASGESPLRSELLSADQMEQHGKTLANRHVLSSLASPDQQLLVRLAENEIFLIEVHNLLTETVKSGNQVTPAGEWLLDNFYLIEEQIRTSKRHLPKGYIKELPHLLDGPSKSLPRVYDIAEEAISHGDGRVDPENLNRFVTAYQTITTLKIGELWAIPTMLRLALIENLRRVAVRVAAGRLDRDLASSWADKMIETAEKDPKSLILVIADMARTDPPMTSAFVSEFSRRLQGLSHVLISPLTWIEQRLSESGQTIEKIVQRGNQEQAGDQVSISNSIGSLRFLESTNWKQFVEKMSIVEQILRKDPGGVYGKMDFITRDSYRHIIEKIAKRSPQSEKDIAQKAIQLTQDSAVIKGIGDRTAHVGFYLIDKGLKQLENITNVKYSFSALLRKVSSRFPLSIYISSIIIISVILTAILLFKAINIGLTGWLFGVIGIIVLLCTSQFTITLVNWISTLLARPEPLPRMDFSEGIPPELRTLVIIPTILMNDQNIKELTEALEVRYLANRDDYLHFGLLTDFKDSITETTPEDEHLIQLTRRKIEELNEKYSRSGEETFFLFHRPRQWNPKEQIWMGYERKRGKLEELNCLLRGGCKNRFSLIIGKIEILPLVKYIITLDTDTQLPRDSARQLVGAIAHPLNRARYDEKKQRVNEGYTILQPRVAVSLPGTNRSQYARLYGSQPGIDPYTRTVSDVYQDIFGEGSFIGKGIYDIDIFDRTLNGRFPENLILSHDLIEGCYARAGLLSDVQLFEEYPFRYNTDVNRRYRWIRGDWQLIRWLLPIVPGLKGKLKKNPLSILSRWKIFDNLRRSLIPLALTLLLLTGWIILKQPFFWTLVTIGIILVPSIIISIFDLFRKPSDLFWRQHISASIHSAGDHFVQAVFTLITLPYEAFFSQDAIIRTIWRMLISHRKLLEWNPFNVKVRKNLNTISRSFRTMWISPFTAFSIITYYSITNQTVPVIVIPIIFLWMAAPAFTWWISLPLVERKAKLTDAQRLFLRKLSRRTWLFFETFVSAKDNWLPPDNYQEDPVGTIAHRTSPTNIGMALLANLSAYDFGYISGGQLIDRTLKTFQTMESLERYQGHFFNWYDTQTLMPLRPIYISSVDSGNLAAYLLTLRQAILVLPDHKIVGLRCFGGMSDTLSIVLDSAEGKGNDLLIQLKKELEIVVNIPPTTLLATWIYLNKLVSIARKAEINFEEALDNEAKLWTHAFVMQCQDTLDEMKLLTPWVSLIIKTDSNSLASISNKLPTLRELANTDKELSSLQEYFDSNKELAEKKEFLNELRLLIIEGGRHANERMAAINKLIKQSGEFSDMQYGFLYDKTRHLLSVGYSVEEKRKDSSYYDLLASEARLSTFVGIADGKLPQESWFALGRLLTTLGGEPILLSWSGSMFEYLMPLLVMPTYENTLLDQTYKAVVKRQIEYGIQRGVPWGISESCYNTVDINLNYQYRAFGVPGLGLKRGLAEDLVIAPYASVLALMVEPEAACINLQRLESEGLLGRFGLYESVDYTTSRLPRDRPSVVVKSFMAHHQGMSLLSLAYLILDRPMQKRFESDPLFESTMLLLQERIPKTSLFYLHTSGASDSFTGSGIQEMPVRKISNPDITIPEVQLLSNGRYNVMLTNAGGGYSRWKDIAITRWREDSTCDNWGTFCYIHDNSSGELWSTAYQPTLKRAKNYEAIFSEGHAEFRRQDQNFNMLTEIVVSPEDDIELRRIHLTNSSRARRTIDLTSYAEVVLASSAQDDLHPAFSNLFVQTEILHERQAILCTRRPRSPEDKTLWIFHMMVIHGGTSGEISFETDRMQFIGRGETIISPLAVKDSSPLSNSEGSVLDPIVAIKYHLVIDPEETVIIDMITGIGESHDIAIKLIEKYQDRRMANRAFELAWTHSQVLLRQINATEADAQLYGRLANSILYSNSFLRADPSLIMRNRRGQSGLWGYSISGDLPIFLLRIEDPTNIELVRQIVQAHAYWRLKGLSVDLVIWNEDHAGYRQQLQEQIMRLIASGVEANNIDRPGGIFVRQADQISDEDKILIQTVARVIITDKGGTLDTQVNHRVITELPIRRLKEIKTYHAPKQEDPLILRDDLLSFNGFGGFTQDGREYIITTSSSHVTPAPWANVIANPNFGTIVSENGPNYTWSENAHEYRITPWHNDPVSDLSGEAFYVRDEETGHFWSPTPLPSKGAGTYVSRHGFGYSVFEHTEDGIYTELWIYVEKEASIKFSVLKIRNESGRRRQLSATGYIEFVLGDLRPKSFMHVITEIDSSNGAIYARNSYNLEFSKRVTFFHTDDEAQTITCDRTEFLGRNGTLQRPEAMTLINLSGKTGAALDPCAAIQVPFELEDRQEHEIIFKLGTGNDYNHAKEMVKRFRGTDAARNALELVWQYWKRTLGAVQVETPDPSLNIMLNGWLLYQTLACRIWARSGYYQSGGAFGFRDQLQDVMSLIHTEPGLIRKHLLLCASRQFREGDVQHWWHPPKGRGVRTHCSDDYLWLPLATSRYVISTGDTGILNETVNFLEGRAVNAEDDSYYDLPNKSEETGTLYEHCVRAILEGLKFGVHGLPLIGTGDWNDGMNMVGKEGKGESIWLGFFLYKVLMQFIKIVNLQRDISLVERFKDEASILRRNIEQNGWDGKWYRRAYFDDGTPLGSESNQECKIDSIAQSWSVLSGMGDSIRSHKAMDSLDKYLVHRDQSLIQLLEPPFDRSDLNPGYIKGYVPGVRENGGQYTHAAIWAAMAFAELGDSKRAWELLNIINPVNRGNSAEKISTYKVEPYVVAADVYAMTPHTGRGGWTWYTGSASWMYRLITESLLGIRLDVDHLYIEPCLPEGWENYKVYYQYRETIYNITIIQLKDYNDNPSVTVDGVRNNDNNIPLVDDHQVHIVEVKVLKKVSLA
ncbi:MAG: glucoamylase family protein [Ignavibacteriaceae bacterium]|nr:glucoamylase family protein [Ignavibacteriaceae bacterium]